MQDLSWNFKILGISLKNCNALGINPVTPRRYWLKKVDKRTLVHLFMAFNLELNKSDYSQPGSDFERLESDRPVAPRLGRRFVSQFLWTHRRICFARAMDPQRSLPIGAVGNGELEALCLLVEQVKEKFEYVIWRSLYNAPPLEDILTSLIQSNSQFLKRIYQKA